MPSRAAAVVCILLCATASNAWACRDRIVDPLKLLAHPQPGREVVDIYVGEIVGVRNAQRLEDLKQCMPKDWLHLSQRDEGLLGCIYRGREDFELEVYPTEVLRGDPAYPAAAKVGGCGYDSPAVGAEAIVFHTRAGRSYIRVRDRDDPDFHLTFDASYLDTVRKCVKGECPREDDDEEDDED